MYIRLKTIEHIEKSTFEHSSIFFFTFFFLSFLYLFLLKSIFTMHFTRITPIVNTFSYGIFAITRLTQYLSFIESTLNSNISTTWFKYISLDEKNYLKETIKNIIRL